MSLFSPLLSPPRLYLPTIQLHPSPCFQTHLFQQQAALGGLNVVEGPCNKPAMLASLLHSISFLACLRLTLLLLLHRIIILDLVVLQARLQECPVSLVGYTTPLHLQLQLQHLQLHQNPSVPGNIEQAKQSPSWVPLLG